MIDEDLRDAIALALFRAEEDDATVEFETDEQWRRRLTFADNTPNPRVWYLHLAGAVLRVLDGRVAPPSALEGATAPGPDFAWPLDPGEYAARWNGLDAAGRAEHVRRLVKAGQTSARCLELDHVGTICHHESQLQHLRGLVVSRDGRPGEVAVILVGTAEDHREYCRRQQVHPSRVRLAGNDDDLRGRGTDSTIVVVEPRRGRTDTNAVDDAIEQCAARGATVQYVDRDALWGAR